MSFSNEEKREIIMDHYLSPKYLKVIDDKTFLSSYHHSLSCADDIALYYKENNKELFFSGNGCAIYKSSTDIFIEEFLKSNLSLKEFKNIYSKLINQESINNEEEKILGKLIIYKDIKEQMNRLECASMIIKAIEKLRN